MASDFAENELDLFRKAVSTATPIAHQPGFLQKTSVFHQKWKLQPYWVPLLPEKALAGACHRVPLSEFIAAR